MLDQFDPLLINDFGRQFLCRNIRAGVVRIYEIDLRTERLTIIDDWCQTGAFESYEDYRAYCFNAVSTNPHPA